MTSRGIIERDITWFTLGGCYVLASCIHRATGWPITAYAEDKRPTVHAWVTTPSGQALDIRGPQTHHTFDLEWEDECIYGQEWHTFSDVDFDCSSGSGGYGGWGRPQAVHKRANTLHEHLISWALV